jgi:hypothetical protein
MSRTIPATTATTVVSPIATETVCLMDSGQVGRWKVGRWSVGRCNVGRLIFGGCQGFA